METIFSDKAWDDYLYWHQTDKKNASKINELIKVIKRTPFEGIGKPEALKHEYSGFWSRRISDEHRLVYRVTERGLEIAQCRFHYS